MPSLVAENVTVYRIPSRSIKTINEHPVFISSSSSHVTGHLTVEDPVSRKFFENLSDESIFLDKLYSISDTLDFEKITEIMKILPESYKITPLSEKQFKQRLDEIYAKFKKTKMSENDFKAYQKEVKTLRKLKMAYTLSQDTMIYILQLTDEGWIDYSEPKEIDTNLLNELENNGLIEVKKFEGKWMRGPYFVKLTERGSFVQKELQKMMENAKQKTEKTSTTEKS